MSTQRIRHTWEKELCMTTHVPGDVCMCDYAQRLWATLGWNFTPSNTRAGPAVPVPPLDSGMTQVAAGPAGGSDAVVLQDRVEVGGCTGAGLSGRERLHGGEDQGQTVCHVLVWGTGQSRRVACRGSTGQRLILRRPSQTVFFSRTALVKYHRDINIPAYLPHLQPWPQLLCSVTPALQSPGLSSLQCEGACMRKKDRSDYRVKEFTCSITGYNGRRVNTINTENFLPSIHTLYI